MMHEAAALASRVLVLLLVTRVIAEDSACPTRCSCIGDFTDCSGRDLRQLPAHRYSRKTAVLDASLNLITQLRNYTLYDAHMTLLTSVNVSHNAIAMVEPEAFYGPTCLAQVDLSWNNIRYLDPGTFDFNPLLRVLRLDYNPRLALPSEKPFLNSKQLQTLTIAKCGVSKVYEQSFIGMPSLEELDLSGNTIHFVHPSAFNSFRHPLKVDLSHNALHVLELRPSGMSNEEMFASLSLEDNPWDCMCRSLWNLREISSNHTLTLNVKCESPSSVYGYTWEDALEAFTCDVTTVSVTTTTTTTTKAEVTSTVMLTSDESEEFELIPGHVLLNQEEGNSGEKRVRHANFVALVPQDDNVVQEASFSYLTYLPIAVLAASVCVVLILVLILHVRKNLFVYVGLRKREEYYQKY